jgi:hypothetical protein
LRGLTTKTHHFEGTTMKKCFRCEETKDYSAFYPHPAMGDGYLGKCKDCTKRDNRLNRAKKLSFYRAYDRTRSKTPARKAAFAEKLRAKRDSDKKYQRAWNAVARALKSGDLVRPNNCERCDMICRPDAHHDDHNKPLVVMWLCSVCHSCRHMELAGAPH